MRPSERVRLIQIDPTVPLHEGSGGWANIASRPDGGACHFLRDSRCGCHSVRPATCAEFPLSVHASSQVQVSLVLTCPGVDLAPLRRWGDGPPERVGPVGLDSEIEAVAQEIAQAEADGQLRWARTRRVQIERRLRRSGRWQSEEEIRTQLQTQAAGLIPSALDGKGLSPEGEELEALPMFFDPTRGRVVWRAHPGGVEFLTLRETGGIDTHLEVLDPPTRSAPLDPDGKNLLVGYLRYVLDRDATISGAYYQILQGLPGTPQEVVAEDLRGIAAEVLTVATLRRALGSGRRGELTGNDIELGIRGTDMNILDRSTAGLRL